MSFHTFNYILGGCFGAIIIICPLVFSQVPNEKATTPEPTPLLPYTGEKVLDEGDCHNWTTIAYIQISSDLPEDKKKKIEPKACKLDHGLECLNITDKKGASKDICKCMISLGPRPTILDKHCYIPAGLGWASECFQNGIPPEAMFPLPYGDPRGSGQDPPYGIDQKNSDDGETKLINYIQWNSIDLKCVPNAECREGANYIGRRCQCFKNTTFERATGTCNGAVSLRRSYYETSFTIKLLQLLVSMLMLT